TVIESGTCTCNHDDRKTIKEKNEDVIKKFTEYLAEYDIQRDIIFFAAQQIAELRDLSADECNQKTSNPRCSISPQPMLGEQRQYCLSCRKTRPYNETNGRKCQSYRRPIYSAHLLLSPVPFVVNFFSFKQLDRLTLNRNKVSQG